MKSTVESLMAIKRGINSNREFLEQQRIERIRKSDIVNEYLAFDEAFRSSKFLRNRKPQTGLIHFRELLTRMGHD